MRLVAEALNSDQLDQLNEALSANLLTWAAECSIVSEAGLHQPLRGLATVYTIYRVSLARSRLTDFRRAAIRKGTGRGSPALAELGGLTTKEVGGRAAGQLAMAKTVATWYGLRAPDFALVYGRVEEVFEGMLQPGLEEAICEAPQRLAITSFTPVDVYGQVVPEVVTAIGKGGSSAINPYVAFPAHPALMNDAA